MNNVSDVLHRLGVTKCYKGHDYIVYCIDLILQDEGRLQAVVKEVYAEAAAHFQCSPSSVERNMRTVVQRAWQQHPALLIQLAGYALDAQPSVSQFLGIIAYYAATHNS